MIFHLMGKFYVNELKLTDVHKAMHIKLKIAKYISIEKNPCIANVFMYNIYINFIKQRCLICFEDEGVHV